jgi:DNA-binding winged helix-turn-helix (wHTH) protein
MKVRIGEFTYDGGRRLLLRQGEAVRLSSKAVQLLDLLLSRRPDAVSREEIQDVLWPESLVTETTLANLVTELRAALGETGRAPRLVRTVWGFGYAFDGDATDVTEAGTPSKRHVLLWGSREFPLREGENVLGRDPDLSVPIVHPSVSREHARITVAGAQVEIEDLESKNGTFVAGDRLEGRRTLRSGETVTAGTVVLLYLDTRAAVGRETETAR